MAAFPRPCLFFRLLLSSGVKQDEIKPERKAPYHSPDTDKDGFTMASGKNTFPATPRAAKLANIFSTAAERDEVSGAEDTDNSGAQVTINGITFEC